MGMNIARPARTSPVALVLAVPPALAALFGAACQAAPNAAGHVPTTLPDAHSIPFGAAHEIITRDGAYVIRWQPVGGTIPINGDFEVDLFVTLNDDAKTPVKGADVSMTCFMPEHGHGMLREPVSEELGGGHYRARGFLLHMDGYWTVSATVMVNGIAASADDELRL